MLDQRVHWLKQALHHLYDPALLQASPLVDLLGISGRRNVARTLQDRLIETIEQLKPDERTLGHARMWRRYEILLYRYVQQLSQREVAEQVGLSIRHLRREQRVAIELLAQRLFDSSDSVPYPLNTGGVDGELAWLHGSLPERPILAAEALAVAVNLSTPLAQQHRVHIQVAPVQELPHLAVHPVAVRQALLSALSLAIRQGRGAVHLAAHAVGWDVLFTVRTARDLKQESTQDASIVVLRQLMSRCGGALELSLDGGMLEIHLSFPAASQLAILAIDDNRDTLRLYDRYLSGSRYRLIAASNYEEAISSAVQSAPKIIVLDVMMPDMDGWELLGRLKQHPTTSHIPIIVCTILPEEELAISLGAQAFLQKPVERDAFIRALDAVAQERAPGDGCSP